MRPPRPSSSGATDIKNICINGAAFTGTFSTNLDRAIANYNALGLSFRMSRTTGNIPGCNAVITANLVSGAFNSSGFPANGRPFDVINIGLQTIQIPISLAGPILMHELGHTIGLRHTDFFNRSISCGGAPTNEGAAGVGAIAIPGSPTGATPGASIMNSCLSTNESGQFSQTDIAALKTLY